MEPDPFTTETPEHDTPPKVCLRAVAGGFLLTEQAPWRVVTYKEGGVVTTKSCHGVNDQNTQLAHANGCDSLLEGSRLLFELLFERVFPASGLIL